MDLALADKSGGVRGAVEKDIERAGEQQERGESLVPPRRAAKHTHRRRPRHGLLRRPHTSNRVCVSCAWHKWWWGGCVVKSAGVYYRGRSAQVSVS